MSNDQCNYSRTPELDNMLHLTPSPAPRIWSSCLAAPTLLSIDRPLPSNDLSVCTRYTTRQPSTVSAPCPTGVPPPLPPLLPAYSLLSARPATYPATLLP